jgi:hypothetical protein
MTFSKAVYISCESGSGDTMTTWPQLQEDWDEILELARDTDTQVTLVVVERLRAIDTRTARLEAWVEVVMKTLAALGLEGLLVELDEARGANYDAPYNENSKS